MPRRGGKAASRRARQSRRARRATTAPAMVRPVEPADAESPAAEEPVAAAAPSPKPARPPAPMTVGVSSRLGEAAQAEYHYVARDLRNIGILVAVMAILLAAAVVAVNLAGISPS